MELFKEFQELESPSDDATYTASRIPTWPRYRVARTSEGNAALLVLLPDETTERISISLKHLRIRGGTPATVKTETEETSNEHVVVIECLNATIELVRRFWRAAEWLIRDVGESPTIQSIEAEIQQLIELFRAMERPADTTIAGLWSELLIIERSSDAEKAIEAWRNETESSYDFSLGTQRLEIKGTTGDSRNHNFSLDQLEVGQEVGLFVGSVLLNRSSLGVSVSELVERIASRIGNNSTEEIRTLERTIIATLGEEVKYRYEDAVQSLRIYEGKNIPKVKPDVPAGVSNVRFQSDMSFTEPIKLDQLEEGDLSELILCDS